MACGAVTGFGNCLGRGSFLGSVNGSIIGTAAEIVSLAVPAPMSGPDLSYIDCGGSSICSGAVAGKSAEFIISIGMLSTAPETICVLGPQIMPTM